MSTSSLLAAAAVATVVAVGANTAATAATYTVEYPEYFNTESKTLNTANGKTLTDTYLVDNYNTFDIVFSGTGTQAGINFITYSVTVGGTLFASGGFTDTNPSATLSGFSDVTVSFATTEDIVVTLQNTGSSSYSVTYSIISPSTVMPAVPLPASGVALLGGAGALTLLARRRKAA